MTTMAGHTASPPAPARLPGLVRLALSRAGLELRQFARERDALVFTFALPIVLLVIFGQIFHGDVTGTRVPFVAYFTAGMVASGVMSVTFVNLGVGIASERDHGGLRRLAGTPLPPAAYFAGKALSALVITVAEVACSLAAAVLLVGVHLPAAPGRWLTFAWVLALGTTACSLLGVAVAGLPRSAASASVVINAPYLVLSFISGVYFVFTQLPPSLQQVAALFPLKWLSQGLQSAFLPSRMLADMPAHSWEPGRVALVLGAWAAASLVLCLKTFRWQPRGQR
jgi:ABC-2 type transport system permease protein